MFCCADTGHDARYVPRDGQSSTCCRRTALVLMRVVWVHVYILHIPTPYMYIYMCVCACVCMCVYGVLPKLVYQVSPSPPLSLSLSDVRPNLVPLFIITSSNGDEYSVVEKEIMGNCVSMYVYEHVYRFIEGEEGEGEQRFTLAPLLLHCYLFFPLSYFSLKKHL